MLGHRGSTVGACFDSSDYDGTDCEDDTIHPDAMEIADDELDEDCDGMLKWSATGERPGSPTNPTVAEGCDCNGVSAAPVHHLA